MTPATPCDIYSNVTYFPLLGGCNVYCVLINVLNHLYRCDEGYIYLDINLLTHLYLDINEAEKHLAVLCRLSDTAE